KQVLSFQFLYYLIRDQLIPRFIFLELELLCFGIEISTDPSLGQNNGLWQKGVRIKGFYLDIIELLSNSQCGVRGKCPRSSGPSQQIHLIFAFYFELSCDRSVFYFPVATGL